MSALIDRRPAITTHRVQARRPGGAVGLLLLLVGLVVASLIVGAQHLTLDQVGYGLTHHWTTGTTADPTANQAAVIIQTLRIPRTLLAVIVGAALGVAGALTQGHTRNAIAEPGLLGVSAGAALAVALTTGLLTVSSPRQQVLVALLGGGLTTLVVFGLSNIGPGRGDPLSLVLLGSAVTALLSSITLALTMSNLETMEEMRRWWVGSLVGRSYPTVWITLPLIVAGLVTAFASAPTLNLLNLGEDIATGLGIDVGRARVTGLLALTLLVGAATAACGPITLLGLMTPHVARGITGPDHRWLLPYAALVGADLLLLFDILGRVMAPSEVPVGVVTALVGAPFFVVLVRHRRMAQV